MHIRLIFCFVATAFLIEIANSKRIQTLNINSYSNWIDRKQSLTKFLENEQNLENKADKSKQIDSESVIDSMESEEQVDNSLSELLNTQKIKKNGIKIHRSLTKAKEKLRKLAFGDSNERRDMSEKKFDLEYPEFRKNPFNKHSFNRRHQSGEKKYYRRRHSGGEGIGERNSFRKRHYSEASGEKKFYKRRHSGGEGSGERNSFRKRHHSEAKGEKKFYRRRHSGGEGSGEKKFYRRRHSGGEGSGEKKFYRRRHSGGEGSGEKKNFRKRFHRGEVSSEYRNHRVYLGNSNDFYKSRFHKSREIDDSHKRYPGYLKK